MEKITAKEGSGSARSYSHLINGLENALEIIGIRDTLSIVTSSGKGCCACKGRERFSPLFHPSSPLPAEEVRNTMQSTTTERDTAKRGCSKSTIEISETIRCPAIKSLFRNLPSVSSNQRQRILFDGPTISFHPPFFPSRVSFEIVF